MTLIYSNGRSEAAMASSPHVINLWKNISAGFPSQFAKAAASYEFAQDMNLSKIHKTSVSLEYNAGIRAALNIPRLLLALC